MKFLNRLFDYFFTACGIVATISWSVAMENAKDTLHGWVCAAIALFMAMLSLNGIKDLFKEKQEEEVADNS